jgi:hypothetical protein
MTESLGRLYKSEPAFLFNREIGLNKRSRDKVSVVRLNARHNILHIIFYVPSCRSMRPWMIAL